MIQLEPGQWVVYLTTYPWHGYAGVTRRTKQHVSQAPKTVTTDVGKVALSSITALVWSRSEASQLADGLNDLVRERERCLAAIEREFAERRAALLAPYKEKTE